MPAGRRTLLGLVSIALHLGALAIVSSLPKPTPARSIDDGEPILVIEWTGDAPRPAATSEPNKGGVPGDATPSEPTPSTTPQPATAPDATPTKPRVRGPSEPSPPPTPVETPPDTPTLPVEPATTPGDRSSPHALALQGLRDRSSSARASVPAPRATPGMLGDAPGEHHVPRPGDGGPGPSGRDDALPRSLADAGFTRNKKGEYAYREPDGHFTATLMPDGRLRFKDHLISAPASGGGTGVRIPGLHEVTRRAQKRELWTHDKAKLSKATFELRLAIAVAFAETQIEYRLKTLYRDLLGIWGEVEKPAVARRQSLFERWDECEERMRVKLPGFEDAEDTRIDTLRKNAGTRARDTITTFVRRQLPKGSTDAYSAEELEQLNRRRHSDERFAPYDEPSG